MHAARQDADRHERRATVLADQLEMQMVGEEERVQREARRLSMAMVENQQLAARAASCASGAASPNVEGGEASAVRRGGPVAFVRQMSAATAARLNNMM